MSIADTIPADTTAFGRTTARRRPPAPRRRATVGTSGLGHLPAARVVDLARRPWPLDTDGGRLLLRGAGPADLPAVAAMHGRSSGQTLLQRYRAGGRAPSLTMVADMLREPLVVVALAAPRHVVAIGTACVTDRPRSDWTTEVGLLVEDAWQGRGIGTALARHLAASLRAMGYGQVSTRSATSSLPLTAVMERVGETRSSSARGTTTLTARLELTVADGIFGGGVQGADRLAEVTNGVAGRRVG